MKNLTRRGFIKNTTALAVGVSAVSLFSGLVNAQEGTYNYYVRCTMTVVAEEDSDTHATLFYHCFFEDPKGDCQGVCYNFVRGPNGNVVGATPKFVNCQFHKSRATSAVCDSKNPPQFF
jgi:hypothetical protein